MSTAPTKKFKVGDKVKVVKSDYTITEDGVTHSFSNKMLNETGRILKRRRVDSRPNILCGDNGCYFMGRSDYVVLIIRTTDDDGYIESEIEMFEDELEKIEDAESTH